MVLWCKYVLPYLLRQRRHSRHRLPARLRLEGTGGLVVGVLVPVLIQSQRLDEVIVIGNEVSVLGEGEVRAGAKAAYGAAALVGASH